MKRYQIPDNDKYLILSGLKALVKDGNSHPLSKLSNAAAYLAGEMEDINWLGFYLYDGNELILGPFWGKPACVRIPVGEGVCGTAFGSRSVQVVADVHEFPGHIVCDPASQSEIVIPLCIKYGEEVVCHAVLDIDSPVLDRFSAEADFYIQCGQIIADNVDWQSFGRII